MLLFISCAFWLIHVFVLHFSLSFQTSHVEWSSSSQKFVLWLSSSAGLLGAATHKVAESAPGSKALGMGCASLWGQCCRCRRAPFVSWQAGEKPRAATPVSRPTLPENGRSSEESA